MRVVALISGGKDSCFNMMHCIANGHKIVALANLKPKPTDTDELDSYMFQTVGHNVITLYAEAMGLPLYQRDITGTSLLIGATYKPNVDDEVEDLHELLADIKEKISFEAVSCGAILSNYQRVRVENVCERLNLQSLTFLWQRNQVELLEEIIDSNLHAIVIKVAALGLKPKVHLGKSLAQLQPHLLTLREKYKSNVCGEGGEYETLTLDCPLFHKRIVIDDSEICIDDDISTVGYLAFKRMHLQDKNTDRGCTLFEQMKPLRRNSDGFQSHFDDLDRESASELMAEEVKTEDASSTAIPTDFQVHSTRSSLSLVGLQCKRNKNRTIELDIEDTFEALKVQLQDHRFNLNEVVLVHLYCADMADFITINSIYKKFFSESLPSRVCIQVDLPPDVCFCLDVCANHVQKACLHVRSVSYWAPANIGPYSQAVQVANTIYFSGSIGLVAASMQVIEGSIANEAKLSLYNVHQVAHGMNASWSELMHCGCVTCYVVHNSYLDSITRVFRSQNMFSSDRYKLIVVVVPRLPKNARVEWHVVSQFSETNEDLVTLQNNFKIISFNSREVESCTSAIHWLLAVPIDYAQLYHVDEEAANHFVVKAKDLFRAKKIAVSVIPVENMAQGKQIILNVKQLTEDV